MTYLPLVFITVPPQRSYRTTSERGSALSYWLAATRSRNVGGVAVPRVPGGARLKSIAEGGVTPAYGKELVADLLKEGSTVGNLFMWTFHLNR